MSAVKGRRQEYTETTVEALRHAARRLFVEKGYAATSVDDIVTNARVSAGALYHHFSGKKQLFRVVYDELQRETLDAIRARVLAGEPSWDWVLDGLNLYLSCCLEPRYRAIVLQEGPLALGWAEWRAADRQHSLPLLEGMLGRLIESGVVRALPVTLTARLLCAAIGEAALTVSAGEADLATAEELLGLLVSGIARG